MKRPKRITGARLAKEISQLLRASENRKPKEIGTVPVDSGSIEFSFTGSLAGVSELKQRVYELTCGQSPVAFDGKRGSIRTGWGDGEVKIVRFESISPRDKRAKLAAIVPCPNAKTIVLGDCGKTHVRLDVKGCILLHFYWVGEALWIGL